MKVSGSPVSLLIIIHCQFHFVYFRVLFVCVSLFLSLIEQMIQSIMLIADTTICFIVCDVLNAYMWWTGLTISVGTNGLQCPRINLWSTFSVLSSPFHFFISPFYTPLPYHVVYNLFSPFFNYALFLNLLFAEIFHNSVKVKSSLVCLFSLSYIVSMQFVFVFIYVCLFLLLMEQTCNDDTTVTCDHLWCSECICVVDSYTSLHRLNFITPITVCVWKHCCYGN